jgi:hypothetical protein
VNDLVALAGGRHLASFDPGAGGFELLVSTPATGQTLRLGRFTPDERGSVRLIGDPNQARLFVWHRQTVTSISEGGVRDVIADVSPAVIAPSSIAGHRLMQFVPRADVLVAVRENGGPELVQYSADGILLRSMPLPAVPAAMVATNDARRVFIIDVDPVSLAVSLVSYDTLGGTQLGAVELSPRYTFGTAPRLALDESGERVIITRSELLEVRGYSLDLRYQLQYPVTGRLCRFDVQVDQRTAIVAVATIESLGARAGGTNARLSMVDLKTGNVLTSMPLSGAQCGIGALILSPPLSPSLQPPVVVGTTVSLRWSRTENTTDYQVEAGRQRGIAEFIQRTNGAPMLTVSDVPAGTYYVRVRSINAHGTGDASEEVTVRVP